MQLGSALFLKKKIMTTFQRLTDDRMYEALLEKDQQFEGIFFVGVKTTGIFCRPSCRARKPKRANVEFFPDTQAAILHGYRPCKVCHPLNDKDETPDYIRQLLDELQQHPDLRIKDAELRQRGLDPNRVRRWFHRNHNMTFQAYQRCLRINHAFGNIRRGENIPQAAFGSGYDSLSGFNESFRKTLGIVPSKAQDRQILHITRLTTPLGPMLAGATEAGICLLEFADRRMLETQLKRLQKRLKAKLLPGEHAFFEPLADQLQAYFEGKLTQFELPLDLVGTDFQTTVWQELMTIPMGETRSYQSQAQHIGKPKAVRAVAGANGDNSIAIIVPCHRVIGSNGHLTGYGGGIWRKAWLLEHEAKVVAR